MDLVENEIRLLLEDPSAFPASVAPAVARHLHDLVVSLSARQAVEVGCCRGFSTLHIAKGLRQTGGKLVSFDLSPREAAVRLERAGLADFVTFIAGNSAVEGTRLYKMAEPMIDFLFVDGDHTRRGCMRDILVFLPLLKDGGILVLHDIYPDRCGWLGPRHAVDLLAAARDVDGKPCFSINERADLDPYGIAVCRKISDPIAEDLVLWEKSMCGSRVAQYMEIAAFEGKTRPLDLLLWGVSKWRRFLMHW